MVYSSSVSSSSCISYFLAIARAFTKFKAMNIFLAKANKKNDAQNRGKKNKTKDVYTAFRSLGGFKLKAVGNINTTISRRVNKHLKMIFAMEVLCQSWFERLICKHLISTRWPMKAPAVTPITPVKISAPSN